jgi:hypothetical protein
MESIKCTEIVLLQDVQNVIEFCREYGMLSDEQYENFEVQLSENSIADYLGFQSM